MTGHKSPIAASAFDAKSHGSFGLRRSSVPAAAELLSFYEKMCADWRAAMALTITG